MPYCANVATFGWHRAAGIMLAFALLVGGYQAIFAQEATPGTGGTTAGAQQNNNDDDGFP
ncbi:MAG: hypothetical protein M3441_15395 [Chloroflexota bacterium]|nr:hypothetical protein [Chloroflexota bacterium]